MEASSNLKSDELEALRLWLSEFDLSRCGKLGKKLNREFSDGILLAEMLKSRFPTIVEMHNYVSCCSVQAKTNNWRILNRKVLKKLDIQLGNEEILKLAKAEPNCIEEVLLRIMKRIETVKSSGKEIRSDTQGCGDQKSLSTSSKKRFSTLSKSDDDDVDEDDAKLLKRQNGEIRELRKNLKILQNELENKNCEIQNLQSQIAMRSHTSPCSSIKTLRNTWNKFF
jgi:hypothetical protein